MPETSISFPQWVDSLDSATLSGSTQFWGAESAESKKTSLSSLVDYMWGESDPQDIVCSTAIGNRLSLVTGTPVTFTDQINKSVLYWIPYNGCGFRLWDGTKWVSHRLGVEISVTLSGLTISKCYDVFAIYNNGNIYIDLGPAWTNDTTRSTAVEYKDGLIVNSTSFSSLINGLEVDEFRGLQIGTIYTTGTNITEDSESKRYVSNRYNQVLKKMWVNETTNSWTYNTAAWRQTNNSASNQISYITTTYGNMIQVRAFTILSNSTGNSGADIGIGVDGLTPHTNCVSAATQGSASGIWKLIATLNYATTIGKHYITQLEWSETEATNTFYGDTLPSPFPTRIATAIEGLILC